MSPRRSLRAVLLLVTTAALDALIAPACASEPVACSPTSSGFGDQRPVIRRDLPGLDDKAACNPHVELLHSADELRAAYQRVGVAIASDSGPSTPGAIALPAVDYTKETVVFREEQLRHPPSWVVAKDATVTVGSQGCAASNEACVVAVFAIDALVTKAEAYTCEEITCAGGVVGRGGS